MEESLKRTVFWDIRPYNLIYGTYVSEVLTAYVIRAQPLRRLSVTSFQLLLSQFTIPFSLIRCHQSVTTRILHAVALVV
jgi:hypothetical protein